MLLIDVENVNEGFLFVSYVCIKGKVLQKCDSTDIEKKNKFFDLDIKDLTYAKTYVTI